MEPKRKFAHLIYDLDKGVLQDVVIVGIKSTNGRTYAPQTLRRCAYKYENAPVYLDHLSAEDLKKGLKRNPDDWVGTVKNVRFLARVGLIADFHFETKIDLVKDCFLYAKERNIPIGFSHAVDAKTDTRYHVIVDILNVHSVDLICWPASQQFIDLTTL